MNTKSKTFLPVLLISPLLASRSWRVNFQAVPAGFFVFPKVVFLLMVVGFFLRLLKHWVAGTVLVSAYLLQQGEVVYSGAFLLLLAT